MGLSQLHQLRGRVGRGVNASKCILLYQTPLGEIARKRLKIIKESNDGFNIAQEDLLIRGPGEILGSRQSGLPELKFANLETDMKILVEAKDTAKTMLNDNSDISRQLVELWFHQDENFLKT
jgi:ATP-dependent DNA helicase RecG